MSLHILNIIGDSHALKFKNKVFKLADFKCTYLTNSLAIKNGSAGLFANAELNQEVLGFLAAQDLIGEDGWVTNSEKHFDEYLNRRRVGGAPSVPDPILMIFGDSILRKSLKNHAPESANEFQGQYVNLCAQIQKLAGARVFVHELDPPSSNEQLFQEINGFFVESKEIIEKYREFNTELRKRASSVGLATVSTWQQTIDVETGLLKEEYEFDGVHLNPSLGANATLNAFSQLYLSSRTAAGSQYSYKKFAGRSEPTERQLKLERTGVLPESLCREILEGGEDYGAMVDSSPSPFWAGLPPIPNEKFNEGILYGSLKEAALLSFLRGFNKFLRANIESHIGRFMIINCRLVHSLRMGAGVEGMGPQKFHYDRNPTGIYRALVYLSESEYGAGPFEWKENENDENFTTEVGSTGLCLLFDANSIFHRAGLPTKRERFALDLILLKIPDVKGKQSSAEYLVQARGKTWPLDPYNIVIEEDMKVVKDEEIRNIFPGAVISV